MTSFDSPISSHRDARRRKFRAGEALVAAVLLVAASAPGAWAEAVIGEDAAAASPPLVVCATLPTLASLARTVAGPLADVTSLASPSGDPYRARGDDVFRQCMAVARRRDPRDPGIRPAGRCRQCARQGEPPLPARSAERAARRPSARSALRLAAPGTRRNVRRTPPRLRETTGGGHGRPDPGRGVPPEEPGASL